MSQDPPQEASFLDDFDESDPYKDQNIDRFPDWWSQNIETFRQYDMRPYRPPRFSDGVLTEEVVSGLEAKFNVVVRLRSTEPGEENSWEIRIDDCHVCNIKRRRDGHGYTEYRMDSDTFSKVVSAFVRDRKATEERPESR